MPEIILKTDRPNPTPPKAVEDSTKKELVKGSQTGPTITTTQIITVIVVLILIIVIVVVGIHLYKKHKAKKAALNVTGNVTVK